MTWPKELPVFPIWNNTDLCDRCFHWWNQSGLSQEQDHCRPMYDSSEMFRALSPQQHSTFRELVDTGIMCPVFEELSERNLDEALTHWGSLQGYIKEIAGRPPSASSVDQEPSVSLVTSAITLVNKDLLKWLSEKPERLHSLSPTAFEDIVAQLFEAQGYNVLQTQATRDGGKDLYVFKRDEAVESLYVVECKRYVPPRRVGVDVARALYGVMQKERVTGGVIVATTYFTRDAQAFAKDIRYQLFLRDYGDLSRWLEPDASSERHNKALHATVGRILPGRQ